MIVKCTCGYAPQLDRSVDAFTQYATYQMAVGLHIMMAAVLRLPGYHQGVEADR